MLAQAVDDVLRYELGEPLVGLVKEREDEAYEDALSFLSQYPRLIQRLQVVDKQQWLEEITNARGH